jgi:hypothetical protein
MCSEDTITQNDEMPGSSLASSFLTLGNGAAMPRIQSSLDCNRLYQYSFLSNRLAATTGILNYKCTTSIHTYRRLDEIN